jgi:protein bicaudal D
MKFRESRTMTDYSELEEENLVLQKQLLVLKQAQVEYEAIKHENGRLKEDLEELNAELEESIKLKRIVEKNLEEALAALNQEREQKHLLKKELDKRITSESLYNLQTIANLHFGKSVQDHQHSSGGDAPVLKHIEGDFTGDVGGKDESPASLIPTTQSVVGDLFSEVHLAEIRKLEKASGGC